MVFPHTYRTEHTETRTTNGIYGQYYAHAQSKKIKIQPDLLKVLQYVDSNRAEFLTDLQEAVEIQSISDDISHKDNVIQMVKFTERWLIKLGVKYECFNIGQREVDGTKHKLPPVILGHIGKDPKKVTVCVYAYLDVNRPDLSKWNTDPWKVTEIDKVVYGNGVASGKGVLMMWFHALAAFQFYKISLPVNVKFIIQSLHTGDSEGLADFLLTKKLDYIFDIDYVVVCASQWIGEKYPCLVYGGVGLLHFEIEVTKTEGSKTEPKDDIIAISNELIKNEKMQIPGVYDNVSQITPDEEKLYEDIQDFDIESVRETLPPEKKDWNKVKLLMNFWRLPAIMDFDVEECTCDKKDFTIVKKKFIIKVVPRMITNRIEALINKHLKTICKDLNIGNEVQFNVLSATSPWLEDNTSHNYNAARRATIQIYKEDPNMIRDDTDSKVINIISRIVEKSVLMLPIGTKSINIGEENENMPLRNFYEGTKLLGAYLFQLAIP